MQFTQNYKKIIHTKSESKVAMSLPGTIGAGMCVTGDPLPSYFPDADNYYLPWTNNNMCVINNAQGVMTYATTSLGVNTITTGVAVESMAYACPQGKIDISATGGGSNFINTSLTASQNAVGKKIRIIAGPGAGNEYTIKYNTVSSNCVIHLDIATPITFDATTKFNLVTGSVFVFSPGTLSATSYKVYDSFTNASYALSVTGLPTTWGTDGQLVRQHTITDNMHTSAVSSSTTTVTTIATPFTGIGFNWTNFEVEIISGTGAGQYRSIASNTGNTITVSTAWAIAPDSTSSIRVKGNRNYLYLLGNNAVTLYRFDIAANTWSTLTPTTARSAAISVGGTADVIKCQEWITPQVISGKPGGQNGRFIYSFRGNSSADMDTYDIATNNWGNGWLYGNRCTGIDSTSCSVADGRYIYIMVGSGRIQRLDVVKQNMEGWHMIQYPPSTAVNGDKMWIVYAQDDVGNIIKWLYFIPHSRDMVMRVWIHSGD